MGNSVSSDDSDDELNIECNDEDSWSDSEFELEKESCPDLDFGSFFEHNSLRIAASKMKDVIPENILQQHSGHLIRWLEERQQRNEEVVTLSQFNDVLMSKKVERENCIQAFQQFDSEGDGTADVATMLEVLKSSSCPSLGGDLPGVVKALQACSLMPGFIDVYNEDKDNFGSHGDRILNFLLRNRALSTTLPFPILNGLNNTSNMRKDVLCYQLGKLKESGRQNADCVIGDGEEVKPLSKCWTSLDVSSNKADISRLTNGDFSSYWQSDGSARSHWIRLKVKSNVVIKNLAIGVASGDQSYMPQVVSVAVGKSVHSLKEVKEVRISSHVTGDVVLFENAKVHYPIIQINIRRCHSDGCDCRVHGIKSIGFRMMREQGVSVMDAAATWYLQVLASTASASIPVAPSLRTQILQHSLVALKHMAPLALSPNSTEKPPFLTQHVLSNMDTFLKDIAISSGGEICEDGLLVMLSFSVAVGSVSGMLRTLLHIQSRPETKIPCGSLLRHMGVVKDSFWKKQGHNLTITLAGCDGGEKEETSAPHNVLTGNWNTAQPYLSADGNTRVNMFFESTDYIQLTKVRIKVEKGPRGPKHGMIFVYKDDKLFNLEEHISIFKGYDTWNSNHFAFSQKMQNMGMVVSDKNPVAFFSTEEDRDEMEVQIDACCVGNFVCIKFLEPRQSFAERLGIVGVKFYGFNRRAVLMEALFFEKGLSLPKDEEIMSANIVVQQVLSFLLGFARDQMPCKKMYPVMKTQFLDMTNISVEDVWLLYQSLDTEDFYSKNLALQLLHALFPYLSKRKNCSCRVTESLFAELCNLVDGLSHSSSSPHQTGAAPSQFMSTCHNAKSPLHILLRNSPVDEKELLCLLREVGSDVNGGVDNERDRMALAKQLLEPKNKELSSADGNSAQTATALLGKVAKLVIVDGAAVFFPDKEARRKQLFAMMTDVNINQESVSVMLTFQSLCQFFSSVDPSGLLDLPATSTKNFDESSALAVMETLLSVAFQEFENTLKKHKANEQCEHLVHLLCSLQTSLLSWCFTIIEGEQNDDKLVAEDIALKYVELLTKKVESAMNLLGEVSDTKDLEDLIEGVSGLFVCAVLRQAVLLLMHLGSVVSDRVKIQFCKTLSNISNHIKNIAVKLPHTFYKYDSEKWEEMNATEVVLRTWDVESTHNYENNQHTLQMFSCPGASLFQVEFDSRCETEKRYDYLEFTDSKGSKMRFDQKVGIEKWPHQASFRGGDKLQFLFHSDSSNNEWGYKFKVIAKGCPDIPLCWMFDLHLSLAKLYGQLCGRTLSSRHEVAQAPDEGAGKGEEELLRSELWTTLFRAGYRMGRLQRSLSGKHETEEQTIIMDFLVDLIPLESELGEIFMSRCRENLQIKQELGGREVNETCRAVFAALLWHTQTLREEVSKFVLTEGDYKISEGIYQAYSASESLRSYLLEQRQREIIISERKGLASGSNDPVHSCKEKAEFLLQFAGLSRVCQKAESKLKLDRKASKVHRLPSMSSTERVYRVDLAMEKYPSFKLVLDFVRDPVWSRLFVEKLLTKRSHDAHSVAQVYKFIDAFMSMIADEDIFQVANIAFLQEIFSYQKKFGKHYASGLEGCGLELESDVRKSFYALSTKLVDSLRKTSRFQLKRSAVMCYDYIQACVLHLLDIDWQLYDLHYIHEINLPQFFVQTAKGSVSMREKIVCEVDEKTELKTYKRNMMWLEECKKEFFKWYEKQNKEVELYHESRHATQLFVAQFCDLLDVEISCDGCGYTLPGRRYRCLQCPDMDLCSSCYAGGVKPGGKHTDDHEIVHLMYKCDECQAFIVGTRIHCDVCEDFDLCLGCQNEGKFPACHLNSHKVTQVPMTKLKLNKELDSALLSYVYQHVWLSFVCLALKMCSLLQQSGVARVGVHHDYVSLATKLHHQCVFLASSCLQSIYLTEDGGDVSSEAIQKRLDEAFALHSQERILGLLGAMLPGRNTDSLTEDLTVVFTSKEFLTQLLSIARGETGHEENTQHFAMGLIGQLLQKASTLCQNVDMVVAVEDTKENVSDESPSRPSGYRTAEFLFSFGASCLERSGLEWANSMAHILQKLFSTEAWRGALLSVISHSIQQVDTDPHLASIFPLFVMAGFPQVLSIGSPVKYSEVGAETKEGVVLKHFPDKNQSLIVDKKSRKRRMIKDELVERTTLEHQVLDVDHVLDFIKLITLRIEKIKEGKEEQSVENLWVLSLALKALCRSLSSDMSRRVPSLYLPAFVQCIVFLASKATCFSKQWLLKDLEILSLTLYTKDRVSEGEKSEGEEADQEEGDAPVSGDKAEDGLTPEQKARLACQFQISSSLLKSIYDIHGQLTGDALLLAVQQYVDGKHFDANEDAKKISKNSPVLESGVFEKKFLECALDMGMQVIKFQDTELRRSESATEEPSDDAQQLIAAADMEIRKDTTRLAKQKSGLLLKKEQEAQGKSGSSKFLLKVNTAVGILYARQILKALLAYWSDGGQQLITAEMFGCTDTEHIPFILDLIHTPETGEIFQKVVQNVIKYCPADFLVPIATTSCQFMEEINFSTITKESSHNYENSCKIEDKIWIPGAAYVSIKFDARCSTEESCDELTLASSADYKRDRHVFSGSRERWHDIELPGDTVYMKFTSDVSNNDWGYKLTASGGYTGRFHTGYMLLSGVLSVPHVLRELNLKEMWHRLVYVACKQTGNRRLKALQLLLKIMHSCALDTSAERVPLDLALLEPLWRMYVSLSEPKEIGSNGLTQPINRALTELFFAAEALAQEWKIVPLYMASLQSRQDFQRTIFQVLLNVAAVSEMIGIRNQATHALETHHERKKDNKKKKV